MSRPRGVVVPGWSRRAPGSSVIGYFVLSGGLWSGCLLAWQVRQPELVVGLLAAGAFVPLVWLAVGLMTRPVWALEVPQDPRRVADLLARGLGERRPVPIVRGTTGHRALFRGCDPLFRIEDPACLIGVRPSAANPHTTILLLPESSDRKALDTLRSKIAVNIERGA